MAKPIGKFKRFFIKSWYNDTIRISTLLGFPLIPIILVIGFSFGFGEYLRFVAMVIYVTLVVLMFIFNDYSNLRNIGLDEYHNKLED